MIDSILPFIFAQLLLGYTLGFVPSGSKTRLLVVVVVACCNLVSVRSTVAKLIPSGVGKEYNIGLIFHAFNFLYVADLEPPKDLTTASQKWWWGFNQSIAARWGTKELPPFCQKDPTYVPTRHRLFLQRLKEFFCTAVVCWLLMKYPFQASYREYIEVPTDFVHRLGEVTRREATIRIVRSNAGLLLEYCSIRACHSLLTCIAMLCGQDPKLWPPVFGNITDAYTVRRYWSHFWHYLMRKSFTLPAATICKKVGLPEKSNLTRFVIVVLAFYFSAVMHILSASPYERCISGPELRYYTSAVVVITVEEILIAMGKKVKRMIKPRKTRTSITDTKSTEPYPVRRVEKEAPHIMLRVLGFIWVLSFHVWMTSNLIYGSWKKCIHR